MLDSSVQLGVVVDERQRVLGLISVDVISEALRAPIAARRTTRPGRGGAMIDGRPFIDLDWIVRNLDDIWARTVDHVTLTVLAVGIGFAISFALAIAIRRYRVLTRTDHRRLRGPLLDPQPGALQPARPVHRHPEHPDRRDRAGQLHDPDPAPQHPGRLRQRPAGDARGGRGDGLHRLAAAVAD